MPTIDPDKLNIAKRGIEFLSVGSTEDSERLSGAVLVTPALSIKQLIAYLERFNADTD